MVETTVFLSTPSARRATCTFLAVHFRLAISIHALREEGDTPRWQHDRKQRRFLSTPSARRATGGVPAKAYFRVISIHALREEGDRETYPAGGGAVYISIHALREEGDQVCRHSHCIKKDFYPRPPRGGRRSAARPGHRQRRISIHALREEGDLMRIYILSSSSVFLSTPSARRATFLGPTSICDIGDFYPRPPRGGRPVSFVSLYPAIGISIHALREEGDTLPLPGLPPQADFYPRPPRGGRPTDTAFIEVDYHFYPRPPRGGRQHQPDRSGRRDVISIHALREEGDSPVESRELEKDLFLSTPSARRATLMRELAIRIKDISIHALREEGDPPSAEYTRRGIYFYPRPPRGGRPARK